MQSSCNTELHVTLNNFTDCLYLLDERFNQLHTLRVYTVNHNFIHVIISNKDKLPNLKHFSLNHGFDTYLYDKLIVPLLQRMINLEELNLYLIISHKQTIVDGIDLKKNILNYMSQLKKFSFSISSEVHLGNEINLPSNDDIQNTFKDFKDNEIISYVDNFPMSNKIGCRMYSYPYRWTNQAFPNVKKLRLENEQPQKKKNHGDSSITTYFHLTELHLLFAHDDYIEEFLTDSKTYLPNTVDLIVEYKAIQRLTENFTRSTTQINCSKLIRLYLYEDDDQIILDDMEHYFPRAKIFRDS
ncbi:unnamed protein product [Adineta steineri]|uniref:Uncharacterized protein n=1 Tax=Adineta steineri TaxID=433720 RepID=A0A814XE12_9BILA|nr:unnamed protein product [Adineta steineri]CAF1500274.1 unnamed protein product [Adineta steineri]